MRRVRRGVKFIEKQKDRILTFKKRKIGLINKARELSVLCGVDACMIFNAPKENNNNNGDSEDLVWSSNDSDVTVKKLINKYKQQCGEGKSKTPFDVSKYYVDKKRKAENMLANLKKKNLELSTWNLKFDSMKEDELRDLANDLEIKINNLKSQREFIKNKRINSSSLSSQVDQQLRSDADNYIQPISIMEPHYMNPMAMNSLHCNSNYNSEAVAMNQMKMAMIENQNNFNYQSMNVNKMDMKMKFEDQNNCYVQPIAMIKPDAVNYPFMQPMFDHYTHTDLQPQFFYDPKPFINYNSGAQTGADAFSTSSFLMNPTMLSPALQEPFGYDNNVFDFSVFGCPPMHQASAFRNSQMKNCVPMQFGDPSLPPLMLEYSTHGHVFS